MGLRPDGDARAHTCSVGPFTGGAAAAGSVALAGSEIFDASAGMALGLSPQIGLITHLFSLLVPALGAQCAALAMGLATTSVIAGRTLVGWVMPTDADRRVVASASYAVQITGSIMFILAAGRVFRCSFSGLSCSASESAMRRPCAAHCSTRIPRKPRAASGCLGRCRRASRLCLAPATFGLVRELAPHSTGTASSAAPGLFVAAAFAQGLAIGAFFAGSKPTTHGF